VTALQCHVVGRAPKLAEAKRMCAAAQRRIGTGPDREKQRAVANCRAYVVVLQRPNPDESGTLGLETVWWLKVNRNSKWRPNGAPLTPKRLAQRHPWIIDGSRCRSISGSSRMLPVKRQMPLYMQPRGSYSWQDPLHICQVDSQQSHIGR
jgi:hypothetical protein